MKNIEHRPAHGGYPAAAAAAARPIVAPIDANALERMARDRPHDRFLKGTGILKLTGAIRVLEGQLGVAVALLSECVGPLQVSAAMIEDEDGGEAIETLIGRAKAFVDACYLKRVYLVSTSKPPEPAPLPFDLGYVHAYLKSALLSVEPEGLTDPQAAYFLEWLEALPDGGKAC